VTVYAATSETRPGWVKIGQTSVLSDVFLRSRVWVTDFAVAGTWPGGPDEELALTQKLAAVFPHEGTWFKCSVADVDRWSSLPPLASDRP
jgi:hypothetical protein